MKDPLERPWSGIGVGGTVALDFVNTMDWRGRPEPEERLLGYTDLLRWARNAGVLDAKSAGALRRWSDAHPKVARRTLDAAIATREAIAAVFRAVARGEAIPVAALARIEAVCRAAWRARVLEPGGGGAAWVWRDDPPGPERPEWEAALDAERLLTGGATGRVRECGDAACGWLFLDTSRNRSRRWCQMEACGNRNKVRRFYRRSAARGRGTRA